MSISFRCPHCLTALTCDGASYVCGSGHSFDRAREGYVNLLPGGRLKGRPKGDDEAMVRARREVFDAGLYAPILEHVASVAAGRAPTTILDAGCGEGGYLAAGVNSTGADGWGIDISKAAVKLAARRHRDHHYAVASSFALPFADATFDIVLNVFAPRDFEEMRRVLVPGGVAVVVTPGPDHLRELKQQLYDDPVPHRPDAAMPNDAVGEVALTFRLRLTDPAMRSALLRMTPYWWTASAVERETVETALIDVTVDVRISTYA